MGQAGKFLRKFGRADDPIGYKDGAGYAHYCPGCDSLHGFACDAPFSNGAKWSFDGNFDKPSFNPSMNIGDNWCHYYLTNGMLIYTPGNKGHGLSGQTIPLPELPLGYRDK